jgi:hypothetical protein
MGDYSYPLSLWERVRVRVFKKGFLPLETGMSGR